MEQRLPAARRLIAAGTLPAHNNVKTYGGPSAGSTCRLCNGPIAIGAPEIEIVDQSAPKTEIPLHPDCLAVWLAAVEEQSPPP
jgi:hypothetical protein